jgi:hypothetical protein
MIKLYEKASKFCSEKLKKHQEEKLEVLKENIDSAKGVKFSIYTKDRCNLGEISAADYYMAEPLAGKMSWKLIIKEAVNGIRLAFLLIISYFYFVATCLIAYLLFLMPSSVPMEELSTLTIGQVLLNLNLSTIVSFFPFYFIFSIAIRAAMGRKWFAGYKNYDNLELRRLLSKSVHTISNCDDFYVCKNLYVGALEKLK